MAEEPGCCCTTTCSQQLCSPPVRIPLGLVWFFYSTHSVWQIAVVMPSSGSKLQSAEWNVVWICPSNTWSLHRKHPLSMVKLLKNHSRIQAATNSYRELTSIYVFCSFCHFLRHWHPETSTPHSHWGFPRGTGHPRTIQRLLTWTSEEPLEVWGLALWLPWSCTFFLMGW